MIPLITSNDNTRPKITNDHKDNKRWFLFNKNHNQSLIGSNSTREQNWLGRSKSIWWPKLKNRTESISESNINYCGLKKWTVNRPVGVKNKIESNKWTKSREIDPLTWTEWSDQIKIFEQKNKSDWNNTTVTEYISLHEQFLEQESLIPNHQNTNNLQ